MRIVLVAIVLAVMPTVFLSPVSAQTGTGQTGPAQTGTAQTGPAQTKPALSEAGRQAFELLRQDDYAGAVAVLEPLREAGGIGPVEAAILGTLYVELGRPEDAAAVLRPVADRPDADAAVLWNAGRASLALGFVAAAEEYFERSVKLVPRSPAARELGLLWGSRGRSFDAYRLLRPWALANPDDHEARIAAAALALRLDRESEAAELVEGLPEEDPKVAMLDGQILLQQGKPEEALTHFEPLLDVAPPAMLADLRRLLADTYIHLGRSEEAIALAPDGPGEDLRLALLLATAHYRQGDTASALAVLEPFAEGLPERHRTGGDIGPLAPQVAFEVGRMLVASGRGEDAIAFLEIATEVTPSHAPAWKSLGDALLAAGRREQAIAARRKFQEVSARENERRREVQGRRSIADPVARKIVEAEGVFEDGEPDEALELLRREQQISPADVRPYLAEVSVLLRLERHDVASTRAEANLGRFPGHPDVLYQAGLVSLARGETAAAETAFRRTLEIAPEHVPALNDLAVLLMVEGETGEAEALLERVLAIRPEDETARRHLGELRGGNGP